jgi:hypothetical protein
MDETVAHGWAVVERGELLVRTVGPTEVSAMVNWLVASVGFLVRHGTSDAQVGLMFRNAARTRGAELHPVTIELREPVGPLDS